MDTYIRIRYATCESQGEKENVGLLFRNYQEFQDGKNRALNQAQGPSKHKALGNYTGYILLILIFFSGRLAKLSEEEGWMEEGCHK